MDYKELARFMSEEIKEYNRAMFTEDYGQIQRADTRLEAMRHMVDTLEHNTGLVITWRKTDPLSSNERPITYIEKCAIEYMDVWGKKHIVNCEVNK